jgi:hypothetical protein
MIGHHKTYEHCVAARRTAGMVRGLDGRVRQPLYRILNMNVAFRLDSGVLFRGEDGTNVGVLWDISLLGVRD